MFDIRTWAAAVLRTTPARWQTLCGTLPADLLARPPAAGEWSALGCLQHLVEAERLVFPVRVRCILEGRDFAAFNPDAAEDSLHQEPDPAALAGEFERLRAESLSLVARLAEVDLARTAGHPELGPVTLGQLIHHWAGHDLMHTVQAEQAIMQPFIEGCGPWLPFFAGHVARK